jgi:hypothetical protein
MEVMDEKVMVVRQGIRQPMFAIFLIPEWLRSMREDIRG